MAATIATINAPVATNRLNLAFATKKTSKGPNSVASLNSGCGWVLSITHSRFLFDASCVDPRDRLGKITGGEGREIVDPLADADEMHRQFVFLRQRHQDSAARGAIELCHDKAGDAGGAMKRLDLRERVLSHRGV